MRTVTDQPTPAPISVPNLSPVNPSPVSLETFRATLRNGKTVIIREMTGKDLVYIEEELAKLGETRKSFHIIELLNIGDDKISYDEIEALGVKDIRKISELIERANGDIGEEGDNPK